MKIADLFVDLHLDTGSFDRELKAALAKGARKSDIKIKVVADTKTADKNITNLTKNVNNASSGINTFTGRISLMADALLLVAPAAVGIGAVAVPAVTALGTAALVTGAAAGTMLVAFQGVGDALTAMTKSAVDPSIASFEAERDAMAKLSPEAQNFTTYLFGMRGELDKLKASAGQELFPGLERGIEAASTRLPQVNGLVREYGDIIGDIATRAGESLASDRWDVLFRFLKRNGRPTLEALADSFGNVAHGATVILDAFAPLSGDGFDWVRDVTEDFDKWASSLKGSEGFKEFTDYVRDVGPQVAETVGAIALALVDIGKAAAPLSGPVLAVIEALAKALSAIAGSAAGPVLIQIAIGLRLISRAMSAYDAAKGSNLVTALTGVGDKGKAAGTGMTKAAAGMTAFAAATVVLGAIKQLNDLLDETLPGIEKVKGELIDLAGVQEGFSAAGLSGEFDSLGDSIDRLADDSWDTVIADKIGKITTFDSKGLREAEAEITLLDDALANMVTSGNADTAEKALSNLADQYNLSADQVKNLKENLPAYNEALEGEANAEKLAADAVDEHASSMTAAEAATEAYKTALVNLDEFLAGRGNLRGYQQAMDDFSKSIKDNGTNFDITTQKGRDNEAALDQWATSALAAAENMKPKRGATFLAQFYQDLQKAKRDTPAIAGEIDEIQDRVKKAVGPRRLKIILEDQEARRRIATFAQQVKAKVPTQKVTKLLTDGVPLSIRQMENFKRKLPKDQYRTLLKLDSKDAEGKADKTKSKVKEFDELAPKAKLDVDDTKANSKTKKAVKSVNELGEKTATPKIDLNTGPFDSALSAANSALTSFGARSETATITTQHIDTYSSKQVKAAGGYVRGPGTATSDSIPARLSDGEFVVRTAAVDKYGVGLMQRINSLRLAGGGLVKRFATGGSAEADKAKDAAEKAAKAAKAAAAKAREARRTRRSNRRQYLFDEELEEILDYASAGDLTKFNDAIRFLEKAQKGAKKWGDKWLALQQQIDDVRDQRKEARQARRANREEYSFTAEFERLGNAAAAGDLTAFDSQITMLQTAQGKTKKWSDEWVALQEQIDDVSAERAATTQQLNEEAAQLAQDWTDARANFAKAITGDFWTEGLVAQIGEGADFRGIFQGFVDMAAEMRAIGAITAGQFDEMNAAAQGYVLQLEGLQKALDQVDKDLKVAEDALANKQQALEDAERALADYTSGIQSTINALAEFSAMDDGIQRQADATTELNEAQETYNKTLATYGANSRNTAAAQARLTAAQEKAKTSALTGAEIVGNVQAQVAKVRSFVSNIRKLRGLGLDEGALKEIVAMGPIQGAAYAEALANSSPEILAELAAARGELAAVGKEFSLDAAEWFGYNASVTSAQIGVQMAQGVVDGLKSQRQAIVDEMTTIGTEAYNALKRVLGIASPSKVFQEIGIQTLVGMQKGLISQVPNTIGIVEGLGDRLSRTHATPGASPVGGGGGAGVVINGGIHVSRDVDIQTLTQRLDFWSRQSGRTR